MRDFQFSKALPVMSLFVLIWCLYTGFTTDFSTIIDVSFYVTSVTVVGSLTITSWVWYLKKAQAENTYKIKLGLYKEVAKVRVHYNEVMKELDADYGEYSIDETPFDQMENDALFSLTNSVEESLTDATEMIKEERCDG